MFIDKMAHIWCVVYVCVCVCVCDAGHWCRKFWNMFISGYMVESWCSWLIGTDENLMNIRTHFQYEMLIGMKSIWYTSNKNLKYSQKAWKFFFIEM